MNIILDKIPLGIILFNELNEIIYLNRFGKRYIEVNDCVLDIIKDITIKTLANSVSVEKVIKYSNSDELYVWRVKTEIVNYSSSQVMVIFEDETTEFRLEQTILKAEKLAVVGHLAIGSLVEIRNPLTSARGFCQLIEEPTKNQKDYIDIISKELAQIQDIVENCTTTVEPSQNSNLDVIYNKFWAFLRNKIDSYKLIMIMDPFTKLPISLSEEDINALLKMIDILNIWIEENTYIISVELFEKANYLKIKIKSNFDFKSDISEAANLVKIINPLKFKSSRIEMQIINNNTVSANVEFPIIPASIQKPHLVAK